MEQKELFGLRLRELREASGMSQQDLADKAGISQIAVSQYERGKREAHWGAAVALAAALGVSCEVFTLLPGSSEQATKGKGKKTEEPVAEKPLAKRGRSRKAKGE